jgi:hypothetical protein
VLCCQRLFRPVGGCAYTSRRFSSFDKGLLSYYHRSLNIPKLVDVKFTYVPRSMTIARMVRLNKVPVRPCLALREMEAKDIPEVAELYSRYMDRFDMATDMTKEEIEHTFLSGRGEEPSDTKGRRTGQIVWSYVVEVSGLLFFVYKHSEDLSIRTRPPIQLPISSHSIRYLPQSLITLNTVFLKLRTSSITPQM